VELLTLLDIERTRFTEQIFTLFDSDNSGKVDFREFVMALWNYCTIGEASLGMVDKKNPYLTVDKHLRRTYLSLQIYLHSTCTTAIQVVCYRQAK